MAWEIDSKHSQATFSVKHMMFTTVRGQFKVLSGHLHIDEQNPANSWVDAQVDTTSIDTNDPNRDNHLRSPDFFDAQKYPIINFKSSNVEHIGGNEYNVTGNLSMHGVTKPVTFNAEYAGLGKDPFGMTRVGLSAKSRINRKDWGLNWNQSLEAGGVLVSENVNIEIDLSAVYQEAAAAPASSQV